MRLCVTGGTGTLGSAFLAATSDDRDFEVFAPARTQFDIGDPLAVAMLVEGEWGPFDWVLNFAAYTKVDLAETERAECAGLNAVAPPMLARAASAIGARFLHISTDCVFSGDASVAYRESDPTAPIQVYGQAKLEGEAAVLAEAPDSIVVRTSWLNGPTGKSFPRLVMELAAHGKPIRAVTDQAATPTDAGFLAEVICAILKQNLPGGIWHGAGKEVVSRFEWAKAAVRAYSEVIGKEAPPVGEALSSDFDSAARRPAFSALDSSKLRAALGSAMPPEPSLAASLRAFAQAFHRVSF